MKKENTENISLITQDLENKIKDIEKLLNDNALMSGEIGNHMLKSFKRANLIIELRRFFDQPEIKTLVLSMKDSQIGFLTDRDPVAIYKAKSKGKTLEEYKWPTIRDCCIEALLSGYRLDNNEFNIISSKMYPAKNGLYRKIIDTEGVSDFKFSITSSKVEHGQAKVQAFAKWKINDIPQNIGLGDDQADKCFIVVKIDNYTTEDSIAGKAARKLFARILPRLGGQITPESELDNEFMERSATESLSEKLKNKESEKPDDPQEEVKEYGEDDITIETSIETSDKKPDKKESESAVIVSEPENLDQIKADLTLWNNSNLLSKELWIKYVDAGSEGRWDDVLKIHEDFKNSYVFKLSEIVDDVNNASIIQKLIKNGAIEKPTSKQNVLRANDEKTAMKVYLTIIEEKEKEDAGTK
ncbi:MAG: hypothetical protein JSU85_01260 [Candidatus Zixiibacteriota bacterium]|nr:MAG: hypothetical protein JSU85_01260 [candidate division Zixibacteria bacterium]